MSADQQVAPTLGQTLGRAGGCPEVVEKSGKHWKIGWPEQAAKACLTRLVKAAAFEEVAEYEEILPAARYMALFQAHRMDIQQRQFETGNEGWVRVMARLDGPGGSGNDLFLLSLMRTEHPEATVDDARRLRQLYSSQLTLALDEVAPAFFRILVEDPNIPPEKRDALLAGLSTMLTAWRSKHAAPAQPSS